jgi:hypothetical protein
MKLRWREMKLLHVLATDLDPRGIGVLIQFGLEDKPRVGRGMTNYIDHYFMTDQRPPPPMRRNMTNHPMFALMPLAGPRRKVPDVERQTDRVGELLACDRPQPMAPGSAPPTIGREEDGVGLRRHHLAPMPPPAPDGGTRQWGRVVIDPPTHPATIVRGIVHPLGTHLPQVLVRKIVRPYAFWLPSWLGVPSPIGTRAHAFLLLRIHRNDRLPRTLAHLDAAVDRAKLGRPLRRRCPFQSLARAL